MREKNMALLIQFHNILISFNFFSFFWQFINCMTIIFAIHTDTANCFLNVRKTFQNSEIGRVGPGRAAGPFSVTPKPVNRTLENYLII